MNKAVFLDKDGTIVDNSQYPLIIPTDKLLHDDVLEGLKHIQEKGYKIILISNQSWIGKGRMSRGDVEAVFQSLITQLELHNINVDDYTYCPHDKRENCACRKPKAMLLHQLAQKHNIDLSQSFMVGDMAADIGAGHNAGATTILVRTGCGRRYESLVQPHHILNNVNQIIEVLK